MNVHQLNIELQTGKTMILDIREDEEISICSIKGSMHIPMNKIPERLNDISEKKKIAVICHTGVRSSYVTTYLKEKGFNAHNVEGGINKWALDIEPSMKKY